MYVGKGVYIYGVVWWWRMCHVVLCVGLQGGADRWMDGWLTLPPSPPKQKQELVFECPNDEHCVLALKVNLNHIYIYTPTRHDTCTPKAHIDTYTQPPLNIHRHPPKSSHHRHIIHAHPKPTQKQDILRRCMEEEVTASLPACFDAVPLTVKIAVGKTLGEMRTIPLR